MEQYGKSLYIYAAVNKVATKVAAVDLRLYKIKNKAGDAEEVLNHEILDLLVKINPFQTRTEFLKTAWINKKLTGEAFWLKTRNARGQVIELWNLRPDLMTVVSDPVTYVSHYELAKSNGKVEIFAPEDVIHFKDPDPLNPFRGMSPLVASKTRIETEKLASEFQRNFFNNNARPDALLVTEQQLDTEQRTQMTSAWDEKHKKDESSKIGILEGGMKYQQVSISQREMDYIESMKFTRDDILVALGVPKSVITTDDVNFANAQTGMMIFLSETVVPEMSQLVEVLNEFLIRPDFGDQFFITYDDPTPSDRESLRADSIAAHGKWATINEIRSEHDLPEIEGGDVIAEGADATEVDPAKSLTFKTDPRVKSTALKLLQGRPLLRTKFELLETASSEVAVAMKAIATAKGKKKSTPTNLDKSLVSVLPDRKSKTDYYNMVNKRVDKRAAIFEKEVVREAALQEQRVIKALTKLDSTNNKGVHNKLNHSDVNSVLNKTAEVKLWSAIALPFLSEYAELGADDAAALTSEAYDMTPQLAELMEARSVFFAQSVTDTTFSMLTSTLTQGINQGDGIGALTERVQEVYGDIPKSRAQLIARTEATYANNRGALSQFQQSDIVQGKEWINTDDDRTRQAHRDAPVGVGGEIVGVNALFTNGLLAPSEYNCRCVLAPSILSSVQ